MNDKNDITDADLLGFIHVVRAVWKSWRPRICLFVRWAAVGLMAAVGGTWTTWGHHLHEAWLTLIGRQP